MIDPQAQICRIDVGRISRVSPDEADRRADRAEAATVLALDDLAFAPKETHAERALGVRGELTDARRRSLESRQNG